jgi:hypothetical protein
MWLLLIYEVAITVVEGTERGVNSYVRRWLRVPPRFTADLPLSSVTQEFKVAKC